MTAEFSWHIDVISRISLERSRGLEAAGSALRQRLNMLRRMTAVMKDVRGQVSTAKRVSTVHGIYDNEVLILIPYRWQSRAVGPLH